MKLRANFLLGSRTGVYVITALAAKLSAPGLRPSAKGAHERKVLIL